jgi:hypothetical protein
MTGWAVRLCKQEPLPPPSGKAVSLCKATAGTRKKKRVRECPMFNRALQHRYKLYHFIIFTYTNCILPPKPSIPSCSPSSFLHKTTTPLPNPASLSQNPASLFFHLNPASLFLLLKMESLFCPLSTASLSFP